MVLFHYFSHISLIARVINTSKLPLLEIDTIILVDASFKHKCGSIGGVVMQNGVISLCWGNYLEKVLDATYAEARALLEALFN